MSKIDIPPINAQFASTAALNARLEQIENELNDKVLYRNNPGSEPNEMNNHLDMNYYSFVNLGDPEDPSSPLTQAKADERYVEHTEVVDNYQSTSATVPLSAARGKDLDARIRTLDPATSIVTEERFQTITPLGGNLDLTAEEVSVWIVNLTEDVTNIELPTITGNQAATVLILFVQDVVGGHTVSGWPQVYWEEGEEPEVNPESSSATSVPLLVLEDETYGVDRELPVFNLDVIRTSNSVEVDNSAGDNATINAASSSEAGVMTADDKVKLDGVEQQIIDEVENKFTSEFDSSFDSKFPGSFDTAFDDKINEPDQGLVDLIDSRVDPETDLGNVVRYLYGYSSGVTDYPVGSIVLVRNEAWSSPPSFDRVLDIYIDSPANGSYTNLESSSTGEKLEGSWGVRGAYDAIFYLAQRFE